MNRTFVAIEPFEDDQQGRLVIRLEKNPFLAKHKRTNYRLDIGNLPSESNGGDWTLQYGQAMLGCLRANRDLGMVLAQALQTQPGASYPICFQISSPSAEGHAWEALHTGNQFAALDRWPVARVIADASSTNKESSYVLETPVRLLAVLSAAGCSAVGEWDSLYLGVQNVRELGLEIDVRVMVGEDALLQQIQATGDPRIVASGIPQSFETLKGVFQEFRPKIVHLYGHGGTAYGIRRLEFASIDDWDHNRPEGSVRYAVEEIADAAAASGVWLVVLNACRTGETTPLSHAFAGDLVMRGVPAAVGMRNAVDCDDAHVFCGSFHADLLTRLAGVVAGADDDRCVELEWAELLLPARRNLRDRHGADPTLSQEWTLPVLYMRPEEFRLQVTTPALSADDARELIGQADLLQAFDAVASGTVPDEVIQGARSRHAAAVEQLATPSEDADADRPPSESHA